MSLLPQDMRLLFTAQLKAQMDKKSLILIPLPAVADQLPQLTSLLQLLPLQVGMLLMKPKPLLMEELNKSLNQEIPFAMM